MYIWYHEIILLFGLHSFEIATRVCLYPYIAIAHIKYTSFSLILPLLCAVKNKVCNVANINIWFAIALKWFQRISKFQTWMRYNQMHIFICFLSFYHILFPHFIQILRNVNEFHMIHRSTDHRAQSTTRTHTFWNGKNWFYINLFMR